jgi:hypothetical protein
VKLVSNLGGFELDTQMLAKDEGLSPIRLDTNIMITMHLTKKPSCRIHIFTVAPEMTASKLPVKEFHQFDTSGLQVFWPRDGELHRIPGKLTKQAVAWQ